MNVQKNVAFSVDRRSHTDMERMAIAKDYLENVQSIKEILENTLKLAVELEEQLKK